MFEHVGSIMGIGCLITMIFVLLRVFSERLNNKILKSVFTVLSITSIICVIGFLIIALYKAI